MMIRSIHTRWVGSALAMALIMPLVSGCAQNAEGGSGVDSQTVGQVLGGVTGAFIGSQFGEGSGKVVAGAAGALLGAWAGSKIVQGMNSADRSAYDDASKRASTAPLNQPITWYNPQTGNQGTITPTREERSSDGSVCREYQQTVMIGGKKEQAVGQACKQADGSWKIVD